VAAIVLPQLACELAGAQGLAGVPGSASRGPFAVIVDDDESATGEAVDKTALIDAVDPQA
jgi:hypothetical protein